MRDQQAHWRELRQLLREAGVAVVDPGELTGTEKTGSTPISWTRSSRC